MYVIAQNGQLTVRNDYDDVYTYPRDIAADEQEKRIIVGDLHANVMKLIFILVREGVWLISKDDFDSLVGIYQTPIDIVTARQLDQFERILRTAPLKKHAHLYLIGDDLCDRADDDSKTIIAFPVLFPIMKTILASNHGMAFLHSYFQRPMSFSAVHIGTSATTSLTGLGTLIERGLIKQEQINLRINHYYLPKLKLIDYIPTENGLIFLSHAHVGIKTYARIAADLNVEFRDETPNELADTIDRINQAFQVKLQNGTVDELYLTDGQIDLGKAMAHLIWNQGEHDPHDMVETHKGYKLFYIHGHHGYGYVPPALRHYVLNTDNMQGRPALSPKTSTATAMTPEQLEEAQTVRFIRDAQTILTHARQHPDVPHLQRLAEQTCQIMRSTTDTNKNASLALVSRLSFLRVRADLDAASALASTQDTGTHTPKRVKQ